MKRKNSSRKEKTAMDEIRPIARCGNCGEIIFDDNRDIYLDDNEEYFCSLSCALEFHGIRLSEDCMVTNYD